MKQETKIGFSLGGIFRWVYPIEPGGFWRVCVLVSDEDWFVRQATLKEQRQAAWRALQHDLYQKILKEKKKKALLSKPQRPPRPYDYSKEQRYTSGMLYIPKTMMVRYLWLIDILIAYLIFVRLRATLRNVSQGRI